MARSRRGRGRDPAYPGLPVGIPVIGTDVPYVRPHSLVIGAPVPTAAVTSTSTALTLALSALLGWGFWDSWFESEAPVVPPATDAVAAALAEALATPEAAPLAALYPEPALRWAGETARVAALLDATASDGLAPRDRDAASVDLHQRRLDAARDAWAALDGAARDTLPDPRPAALAGLDLALSGALVRAGDALAGGRADPRRLYPGVWHPTLRDTSRTERAALAAAIRAGSPDDLADALDALRPQQDGYGRLRQRLAALDADLAPVPSGQPLLPGDRSVRVPHLRHRLTALGYLPADRQDPWLRPAPYVFDRDLAGAFARFEAASGLPADSVLDADATRQLNADPAALRRAIVLNLERWRWLPDDLGERFVWVNLPSFEIRALERADTLGGYAERLQMPANIGTAETTGWTTPVITDSIHTLEFQPMWFVPRSLAASNIFPMARADSLSLWRQGIEAYRNGVPVDTRLVPWDSVSVGEFRFRQRPGPANPLGRVKFMMHNPYAILIHDTNRRQTFADGEGSSVSSGCVHAGDPARLAEYLMTTTNGWEPGAATAAWRRGPRRGVRLAEPVLTHFTYFTAWTEPDGSLRTSGDPYGYDDRLAEALGLDASAPVAAPGSDA